MVNGNYLIYLLRGWDIDDKVLIDKYKKTGFDEVAFYLNNTTVENLENLIVYAKSKGLEVNYVHGPLKENSAIWIPEQADEYVNNIAKCIEMLGRQKVKYFVMHPAGKEWISFTDSGIENFKKLVNLCEKNKVTMLLENLRTIDNMFYVFDKVKSKNLGFCLDTGHANIWCLNPYELIKKYKNKLWGVHIHDNDGTYCADQHLLPFNGTIDWYKLMPELCKYYNGPISLEIDNFKTPNQYQDVDFYLKDAMKSAKKLNEICQASYESQQSM